MKICRTATVPFFLQNHLRSQILATARAGHDLTLVSSEGPEISALRAIPRVKVRVVEIPREISPLSDAAALWKLFLMFRKERFDIVHSTTPKAGMLTMLAGWLAGVPVRLHTFTGQVWVERSGLVRFLAKAGDKLTAFFATQCYADSFSQRDFIVAERIAPSARIKVLGQGSLAGVDTEKFEPRTWESRKSSIRDELGIPPGARVITFIGRLTRDKGLNELIAAYHTVCASGIECVLLLVGPKESDWQSLNLETQQAIESDPGIKTTGYSAQPEKFLAITDVFCLPSYREGFGNVVIESAAMGVPSVGSDIIGLRDSILHGRTGLLVRVKDSHGLAEALVRMLNDAELCKTMGEAARARATSDFSADRVNSLVLAEYVLRFSESCMNR